MKNKFFSVVTAVALAVQLGTIPFVYAADAAAAQTSDALYSEDFEGYVLDTKWKLDTGNSFFVKNDPLDESETDKNKVVNVNDNSGTVNIDLGTEVTSTVDISFRGFQPSDDQHREWGVSANSNGKRIATLRTGLIGGGTTLSGYTIGGNDWTNRIGMLAAGADFASVNNQNRVPAENLYTNSYWEVKGKWTYVTMRVNFEEQKVYTYVSTEPITAMMIEEGSVDCIESPFMEAADSIDSISVIAAYRWGGNKVSFDDIKVVPSVTIPRHTVTFRDWDGSETTETVLDKNLVPQPEDPEKRGYVFEGWFLNGEKYDFETPVTGDMVLEAKYSERTVYIDEDFEEYEIGANVTASGWTGDGDYGVVIADPYVEEGSAGKVLQASNKYGRSIKKSFDAAYGISDVSFRMAWNDVQSYSHTMAFKSGNNLVARFGLYRIGWGNNFAFMNKDMSVNSGNTNESDVTNIGGTSENTWYNVKLRIDSDAQNIDAVIAPEGTVITEDMMEFPEEYTGLLYVKDVPFITTVDAEGNKIDSFDNISIELSSWNSQRTAYYDDLIIKPYKPIPKYNVTFRDWDGSETVQVIRENEFAEMPEAPVRPGYMFDGWFLDGELYNFEAPVMGNIVLEAHYTKRTIVLDEDFEGYSAGTNMDGQDGWEAGWGNISVVDDANAPGENKLLKIDGGYSATKAIEPTAGIFDVSYAFSFENKENARGQGIHFMYGDKYIARLGVFRSNVQNWRNDFGFYKNDEDAFQGGNTNESLYNKVLENVVEKHEYFVKVRFDFNNQTATAVVANEEVTDEAMTDLAAALEAGDILGYWENMPFLNDVEYLDKIIFDTPISSNVTYYDDFYIANVPEKQTGYAINNASWTQDGENVSVSANITKGAENAVIFTAVYNDENELIAADVNRELSSVSEGETYNYQVQLSAAAADSVKIMVWDTELIPKTGLAVAEFVQQ
jgi:hypothetical protein